MGETALERTENICILFEEAIRDGLKNLEQEPEPKLAKVIYQHILAAEAAVRAEAEANICCPECGFVGPAKDWEISDNAPTAEG